MYSVSDNTINPIFIEKWFSSLKNSGQRVIALSQSNRILNIFWVWFYFLFCLWYIYISICKDNFCISFILFYFILIFKYCELRLNVRNNIMSSVHEIIFFSNFILIAKLQFKFFLSRTSIWCLVRVHVNQLELCTLVLYNNKSHQETLNGQYSEIQPPSIYSSLIPCC